MKKILITAVVLAFAIGAVAYAMSEIKEPKTYSWRYKMTVEIDTPEGVKSGSAVREITVVYTPKSSTRAKPHRKRSIKGEAVVIDLGEKGKVFATLGVDYALTIIYKAFPVPFAAQSIEGLEYYSQLKDKKVVLDEKLFPRMVMFENLNNPATVNPVYGRTRTTVNDQFKERFGKDYGIKQVIIETTNDNVTWGLIDIFPWLPNYYNKRLDGNRYGTIDSKNRVANGLASGSFSAGGGYNGR